MTDHDTDHWVVKLPAMPWPPKRARPCLAVALQVTQVPAVSVKATAAFLLDPYGLPKLLTAPGSAQANVLLVLVL